MGGASFESDPPQAFGANGADAMALHWLKALRCATLAESLALGNTG